MKTLTNIFDAYRTDKGSIGHGAEIHNYGLVYERYFEPIRNNSISLLEIGVLTGASLKSWSEYFPNGEIFGIDNDEKRIFQTDRIKTYVGDQAKPHTIANLFPNKKFDIIIDDGSHQAEHQQLTFDCLFEMVTPGGYYVIEDLHAAYMVGRKRWAVLNWDGRTTSTFDMVKNQLDKSYYISDDNLTQLRNSIEDMWYNEKIVVFKKK